MTFFFSFQLTASQSVGLLSSPSRSPLECFVEHFPALSQIGDAERQKGEERKPPAPAASLFAVPADSREHGLCINALLLEVLLLGLPVPFHAFPTSSRSSWGGGSGGVSGIDGWRCKYPSLPLPLSFFFARKTHLTSTSRPSRPCLEARFGLTLVYYSRVHGGGVEGVP